MRSNDIAHEFMTNHGASVRRTILKQFRSDSCIASTRVGQALMEMIRRESFPLSVTLSVFNRAMMIRAEQEGGLPQTQAITRQWSEECGAWSVGVGFPVPGAGNDRWPGHLVLIVQRKWLWDLSIDQANRPQHGIAFKTPPVVPVTERFLRGREKLVCWWDGSLLVYDARPDDKSFRLSNNWDMDIRFHQKKTVHDLIEEAESEKEDTDPFKKMLRDIP